MPSVDRALIVKEIITAVSVFPIKFCWACLWSKIQLRKMLRASSRKRVL